MNDSVTITTSTSWFSRLGSAFRGVVTGLVILFAALGLLFWNEGRTVNAIRTNSEGSAAVTPVPANAVNPANEGRLIHITGPATAEGARQDLVFGISTDALVLARKVEYYQWHENRKEETRTKLGGGEETITTYSYDRRWSDSMQDSANFHQAAGHQNPLATLKNAEYRAERGKIGAFIIDHAVLNSLTADQPFTLTAQHIASAAKALTRPVSSTEGGLYIGQNSAEPQVGDMRVSYRIVPQATMLSIVGAQTSGTLQAYPTKSGSPILMVRTGTVSADQMFAQAKATNKTMAWLLRGLGFIIAIAGLKMVLGPLGVIGDVVPFVGSILRMGTGFVATVIGLALGSITIAVAWLFYRTHPIAAALWWSSSRAS